MFNFGRQDAGLCVEDDKQCFCRCMIDAKDGKCTSGQTDDIDFDLYSILMPTEQPPTEKPSK